jgi:hypothetical protein
MSVGKQDYTNPAAGTVMDIGVYGGKKAIYFNPFLKDSVQSPRKGFFGYDITWNAPAFYDSTTWQKVMSFKDTNVVATKNYVNTQGFITAESDPTVPSHVKAISTTSVSKWDNKVDSVKKVADTFYCWINGVRYFIGKDSIGSSATWGNISGTLSSQTDLQTALNSKENSIGYTPENTANKATSFTTVNNTLFPTVQAVDNYVTAAITALNISNYVTISSANASYVSLVGSYTNPSWLVSIPFSKVSATPTTLSGYGITDATSTARAAITFTTTGTSGAATYNSSTGALNIPTISSFSTDISVNGLTVGRGGGNRANNIAIGVSAGAATATNSTSYPNINIGLRAGTAITSGYAHLNIGTDAGKSLISGDDDIAIGYRALYKSTASYYTIAIGNEALLNIEDVPTVTYFNTSVGHYGGRNLGSGAVRNTTLGVFAMGNGANIGNAAYNTAVGGAALYSQYNANYSTGVGYGALFTATSTVGSTALGYNAGYYATGNGNTWLGTYDGSSHTNVNNHIFLSDGENNLGLWFNSTKAATFTSTIKTAQPSANGAGAIKIGKVITGASVTIQTDKYLEVEIDGTIYKLAIVQ